MIHKNELINSFKLLGITLILTIVYFTLFDSDFPLIPKIQNISTESGQTALIETADISAIDLETFLKMRESDSVLLIDARSVYDFEEAHIPGAVNIPYESWEEHIEKLEAMDPKTIIITYCDGSECMSSVELANDLRFMFEKVYYFFGGWNEWRHYHE